MATHTLKTWPGPFAAILALRLRHEVRPWDRDYVEGDVLHLREYDPTLACACVMDDGGGVDHTDQCECYTGREIFARVTYLTARGTWGIPADVAVMSIEAQISTDDARAVRAKRRSASTQRMTAVNVAEEIIRDQVPRCVCTHTPLLHGRDGGREHEGPCSLCDCKGFRLAR